MPDASSIGTHLPGPGATPVRWITDARCGSGEFARLSARALNHAVQHHDCETRAARTGTARFGYPYPGFVVAGTVVSLPSNSRGDSMVEAHPPRAIGVAQCVESEHRLRGAAAHRVARADIALAHGIAERTTTSAVTFLEGPGTYGG